MRKLTRLTALLVIFSSSNWKAYGSPIDTASVERAILDSVDSDTGGGYAPLQGQCPGTRPTIRTPLTLSDSELEWLPKRRKETVGHMKDFLRRMNIPGFDAQKYIDQVSSNVANLPNIGIAVSGGGYRALTNGAGALAAFDSRTSGSTDRGHLGGLLQSTTYVSGLSGGGWLVGSLYSNNFSSVQAILGANLTQSPGLWQFSRSIIDGPKTGSISAIDTLKYFKTIYDEITAKRKAGFDVSLTDFWGRGLAFQLVAESNGGAGKSWSSLASMPDLAEGKIPLPILVTDGRAPGQSLLSLNATVFEINPWEMGSFDPVLFGMAPTKYVGSSFHGGILPPDQNCVTDFDNAGFVMGTSSSLFNAAIGELYKIQGPQIISSLTNLLKDIGRLLDQRQDDIASWSPNPFYQWNPSVNTVSGTQNLTLVDGGEDGQNVPFYPHIQPLRQVDVVFAVDSSADSGDGTGWPNGTALIASYERTQNASIANGTVFPAVPDVNSFINLGLNALPTFFGCDPRNLSGPSPLIVYIPNHPYSYFSNITTLTTKLTNEERNLIIQNGYNVATMGNGTVKSDWPVCVGCAVLSRSLDRTKTPVPTACQKCFQQHCWNGTVDSKAVPPFDPPLLLKNTFDNQPAGGKGKKNGSIKPISAPLGLLVAQILLYMLLY